MKCIIILGMGGALLAASPALAQSAPDDTWIRVGAYMPTIDTQVSVARPGQEDLTTLIDLESDLALSKRDVLPEASIGTRLGRKWRVEGEFFTLARKGQKTLARDVVFDGVTYPVSATIDSKFSSEIYRLSVGYSFVRNDKSEFGAAIGAHVTNFGVSLAGTGSVGGATASTQVRRKEVLAPLPTVGLYGSTEIAPKLRLSGQVDYLSLKIDNYDGRLVNLQAGAAYSLTRNLRLGAMYRRVDYRLKIDKNDYKGRVDYTFDGPMLFAELAL